MKEEFKYVSPSFKLGIMIDDSSIIFASNSPIITRNPSTGNNSTT